MKKTIKKNQQFLLVEMISAQQDGYYSDEEIARGVLDALREQYPYLRWILTEVIVPIGEARITDRNFHARNTEALTSLNLELRKIKNVRYQRDEATAN